MATIAVLGVFNLRCVTCLTFSLSFYLYFFVFHMLCLNPCTLFT